jgi:predicted DNA-binding protein
MKKSENLPKQLAVNLPRGLHHRLKLESVHRERTIQSIVVAALEAHLPEKIEVVVRDARQKRSASAQVI